LLAVVVGLGELESSAEVGSGFIGGGMFGGSRTLGVDVK
jgi:hypothetical protein